MFAAVCAGTVSARRATLLVACAACCALAGCRGDRSARAPHAHPAVAAATPSVERLPDAPRSAEVRLTSATESTSGDAEPVAQGPATPQASTIQLSLFDAVETGLRRNPDLNTIRRNEGVSLGALGVAETYPFNPFVQVQATPYQSNPNGGPGTVYHYVLVMQTLQLAHQQRHREDAAWAALQSVRWNILQAELTNIAQTERLYFTALYLQGLRDVARANAELNAQLLDVSHKQLAAGQAAAADVAIVRVDEQATRQQLLLAEANYQTALLDLRRHLNLPLACPLALLGDLADCRWRAFAAGGAGPAAEGTTPPVEEWIAGRPDVMATRADLAAARANANLARSSRVPDLQLGPYYQRSESGFSHLGFRAQMDMPVINNGVPLVRQREAEIRLRLTAWQQTQARAAIEAQAAVDRYERARRLVGDPAQMLSDDLPVELQKLETQFRAGEVDVVRIFTARTSLVQLRRTQLDSLNELAQASATLTAATGAPPHALIELR